MQQPLVFELDWPDAEARGYTRLVCFECLCEYRGPRNEPYCWACTNAKRTAGEL